MSLDEETTLNFSSFIRKTVQDISDCTEPSGQFLASQLIESCKRDKKTSESTVNVKHMCPHCFSLWKYGQYQIKSKPKIKRKGKYKVTALEITCLNCKKKVKVNNSKERRSKIERNLSKVEKKSDKLRIQKKNNVEQAKSKLDKHDISSPNAIKNAKKREASRKPTLAKLVDNSCHNKPQCVSQEKSIPSPNTSFKNNFSQKINAEKKRIKLQKHLQKSSQRPISKPKSVLEDFLNSVNNI